MSGHVALMRLYVTCMSWFCICVPCCRQALVAVDEALLAGGVLLRHRLQHCAVSRRGSS